MRHRNDILSYLNELLNVPDFDDYCINGLQVEGKAEISKIVGGVSVSARLFREAIERRADMIIVHHGLFWKNDPVPFSLTGIAYNRISLLIKNDINLAGYHLPLDAHPDLGNNAQLIKMLDLTLLHPVDVGFLAQLKKPLSFTEFVEMVNQRLERDNLTFPFGKKNVSKVLIISGGAASDYPLALEYGADTFLTGEIKESLVRPMEEVALNLIIAGHYQTEKFGVQALGHHLQDRFDISFEFIDIPNPI